MTEDSILIRAGLTDRVLEYVHSGCDDHSDLRTTVSRDRKFRVGR